MFRIPKTVIDGLVVFGIGGLGLWVYSQWVHSQPQTDSLQNWTFEEWVVNSPTSLKYLQGIGDGTGIYLKDRYVISHPQQDCLNKLGNGEDVTKGTNFYDENSPVCKKDTIQYLTSEYKKYNPGGPVPKFLNTTSTTIVKSPQVQENTTVKSQEQTLSEKSVNTTETQNNTSVTSQKSTISNNTVNTPFISTSSGKSDLSSQYSSLGDVTKMCKENTSVNRTIWKQDEYELGYHSYVYGVGGIIVLTNKVYLVPYEEKTVNGSFQTWKDPSTKLIKGMYPNCENVSEIGVFGEQYTTINDNWLFYTRCESYCERLFKLEDQNGSKVINFYHKSINGGTVQKITFK